MRSRSRRAWVVAVLVVAGLSLGAAQATADVVLSPTDTRAINAEAQAVRAADRAREASAAAADAAGDAAAAASSAVAAANEARTAANQSKLTVAVAGALVVLLMLVSAFLLVRVRALSSPRTGAETPPDT